MKKYFLIVLVLTFTQTLLSQTIDANGKKQGYWKKKDDKNNALIYEGMFKDDKPIGLFGFLNQSLLRP